MAVAMLSGGCSSVEVVRLQPDLLRTPKGTEPLAALQVTTMGFFFMTLGMPEADLDQAVNELLFKEARKLGADQVINLRFDVTPSRGVWFLTKLLWFRVATAWGIAVVDVPDDEDAGGAARGQRRGDGAAKAVAVPAPGLGAASRPASAPGVAAPGLDAPADRTVER